jgi:hypothetical protein
MSAISPKNPIVMAVLAVGTFYLLSQRKASAATLARPYGSSAAAQTAPVAAYYAKPSTAAQYASYAQGRSLIPTTSSASNAGVVTAGLNLVNNLVSQFSPNSSSGGYFAGNLGTGVSAEIDGNVGEAAARTYYLGHADEFIPDMPTITADMTNAALLEGMSEY